MIESKKGGRGRCHYCGEWYNDVSYHEVFECNKKTLPYERNGYVSLDSELTVSFPRPKMIYKDQVLEILDKYRNSVGVKYAIEEIKKL